jgi:hypothetical protein
MAHVFFPQRQGLRRTFPEIRTKFDAVSLFDSSRNRNRPDIRLQIKGRKKSARPASCVKPYTLTPKIC